MAAEILLDLGNTRLKARAAGVADLALTHADDTSDWLAGLAAWWPHGAATACLASVAPKAATEALRQWLQSRGVAWREARTVDGLAGLQLAYPEPSQLGVDRFLALLDAHHRCVGPCVLVSAGTAVTVDSLDAEGRHGGGWILASPALQREALAARLPQLPPATARSAPVFAHDTANALGGGSWATVGGAVLLAARMAAAGQSALCPVQVAGGDAEALQPWLRAAGLAVERRDDAVLAGLAVWAATTR